MTTPRCFSSPRSSWGKKENDENTERSSLYIQPSDKSRSFRFSSDHSNVTHHFCQTFTRRFHCSFIPITQWQCICFVSLNYSVTQRFLLNLWTRWSASGKPGHQEALRWTREKKTLCLLRVMNSADRPPGESSSQPSLATSVLLFGRNTVKKYCRLFFHILVL